MGRIIAFSEFEDYYRETSKVDGFLNATLLDTNPLVSLSYEIKTDHEETVHFFESISDLSLRYFATVNTKAEFIDFHRRLMLTENLVDTADKYSKWKIPARAKGEISSNWGAVLSRQKTQGSDPVFGDHQLKEIKKAFSAGRHSGNAGWLILCESFLGGKMMEVERLLAERGVEYISQHVQADLFTKKIDWPDAVAIMERTGLSASDAMILNAVQCSRCSFLFSADFDVGYATLSDKSMKDVVMPDSVAKDYRHFHFTA